MEARVARLESGVGHIKDALMALKNDARELARNVTDIKVGLATVTERVNNLPTKGFVVSVVLAALAVIAALFVLQGNLQQLLRVLPLAGAAASPR